MRPDAEELTADDRFHEIAKILAVGVLRFHVRPTPAHDPISENPHFSLPHVLEPDPQPSLIH